MWNAQYFLMNIQKIHRGICLKVVKRANGLPRFLTLLSQIKKKTQGFYNYKSLL